MKKMRWLALCTALLISGMSFAGCNGKEENSAADSAAETMKSTEETTEIEATDTETTTEAETNPTTEAETEPETEAPTEEPEPEELAYWQELYLSLIESEHEYENSEYNEYALVHIDNDDIPELVGSYSPVGYTITTCRGLYTSRIMNEDKFVGYIPRTGIFGMETIVMDISDTYFKEYELQDAETRKISEYIAKLVSYDSFYYTVDSSSVSKEEYDAACQAKRDSYTQPVYYSYEEMKEILSAKYIPPQDEINNTEQEETDWKTAYQWVVYDYEEEWSEYYYDMEYALIYVDNNDIPELYMKSTVGQMRTLYTCYNNQAMLLIDSQGRDSAFSPSSIVEKNSKIWTVGSGGSTVWSYDCFTLYKGLLYRNESVTFDCYEDEYTINNEAVSEDEFYDKDAVYGELSNQGSVDIVYYSYDEIMELLQ